MNAARPPISPVVARLLVDPENESKIERVLLAYGWPSHEVEDGRQDVYVKILGALGRGHPPPEDLRAMKAFCAEVARNHAIDRQRRAKKWERYLHENVEPDEYSALEYGAEQRDPVDARRQLEVLGQLFAEGKMPEHGVEILHEVASGTSCADIGEDLEISERAVRGRLDTMQSAYRKRMVKLGIWPGMDLLRLVSSTPGAIATLRKAA
jgi:RNA polymerase sigma factor (sigma-70 family)